MNHFIAYRTQLFELFVALRGFSYGGEMSRLGGLAHTGETPM